MSNDSLPPATSTRIQEILHDPAKLWKLKVELAVTIDAMEPFVKVTYALEGDGPLAFTTYESISMLYSSTSTEYFPNVEGVARQLSGGDTVCEGQLLAYAKVCAQPAYSYFRTKLDDDLKPALVAYKAAQLFLLLKAHKLKPLPSDVDSLRTFTFLNSTSVIDGLNSELPEYLAAA